ncbi:MAG: hypothetical protein ACRC7N_12755 [Clostridium sp.]
MGFNFKEKMDKYFRDSYIQKYGDRITSSQGTLMSIKIEEKSYVVLNKIVVDLIIKPDMGKSVVKARYTKKRWFKKPEFLTLAKGHKVMIMGLKGVKDKKDSEIVVVQNILNLTTKRDLIPVDHSQFKKVRQQTPRVR